MKSVRKDGYTDMTQTDRSCPKIFAYASDCAILGFAMSVPRNSFGTADLLSIKTETRVVYINLLFVLNLNEVIPVCTDSIIFTLLYIYFSQHSHIIKA